MALRRFFDGASEELDFVPFESEPPSMTEWVSEGVVEDLTV